MCGRCTEGAQKVHGRCNANDLIGCGGVRGRCMGGCVEGAWELCGRCMGGAQKVCRRCNANDLIGCGGDP